MRTLIPVLAAIALPALAGEPKLVTLKVGEEVALGGNYPICDAPSVAVISADGRGILKGVGAGETLCSVTTAYGQRQVYKVVVRPKDAPARQ